MASRLNVLCLLGCFSAFSALIIIIKVLPIYFIMNKDAMHRM